MNRKQRACLTLGFLLLVVTALYPPWKRSGYGFLFADPYRTLDLTRLLVEWALIVFVTGGLTLWFRKSHSPGPESSEKAVPNSRAKRRLLVSVVIVLVICVVGLSYYAATRKVVRDLPPIEVAKVTGLASITNFGSIELNAYNGSDLVLTEITVSISVFNSNGNAVISSRAYRLFPSYGLNPQSSGKFSAESGFTWEQGQTWRFTIVGAKGRPE